MPLLTFLALLSAQPGPVPPAPPVVVGPGQAPQGSIPVPISEVAEPLGLAIAGFDADHDGSTSRAEYEQALARTFAAADNNGSGDLGYLEYARWAETWLGSQSALPGPFAIDADGDTRLSRVEFLSEFGRQFTRLDKECRRNGQPRRAADRAQPGPAAFVGPRRPPDPPSSRTRAPPAALNPFRASPAWPS
jgi:hypothetical protein